MWTVRVLSLGGTESFTRQFTTRDLADRYAEYVWATFGRYTQVVSPDGAVVAEFEV